jgi:predicted amidohydrolase
MGLARSEGLGVRLVLVQPRLPHGPEADPLGVILGLLAWNVGTFESSDIVLLPEGVHPAEDPECYARDIARLARNLGCHVIGGSHRERLAGVTVNAGVAFDPDGSPVGRYEKLRPYAEEARGVRPGTVLGELTIGGRDLLVLICADFWYADVFQRLGRLPEVVLVCALSVTRKATGDFARTLWRHLAVTRAYEFGTYVGISDWASDSEVDGLRIGGVGGFADPTATTSDRLFTAIPATGAAVHRLDFAALRDLREERRARGFLCPNAG